MATGLGHSLLPVQFCIPILSQGLSKWSAFGHIPGPLAGAALEGSLIASTWQPGPSLTSPTVSCSTGHRWLDQAGWMWGVKGRTSGGISGFWPGWLGRREKGEERMWGAEGNRSEETPLRKMANYRTVENSERRGITRKVIVLLFIWDFLFFPINNMLYTGGCLGRPHCSQSLPRLTPYSLRLICLGLEGFLVFETLLWKANMPPEAVITQCPLNRGQWIWTKLPWLSQRLSFSCLLPTCPMPQCNSLWPQLFPDMLAFFTPKGQNICSSLCLVYPSPSQSVQIPPM